MFHSNCFESQLTIRNRNCSNYIERERRAQQVNMFYIYELNVALLNKCLEHTSCQCFSFARDKTYIRSCSSRSWLFLLKSCALFKNEKKREKFYSLFFYCSNWSRDVVWMNKLALNPNINKISRERKMRRGIKDMNRIQHRE